MATWNGRDALACRLSYDNVFLERCYDTYMLNIDLSKKTTSKLHVRMSLRRPCGGTQFIYIFFIRLSEYLVAGSRQRRCPLSTLWQMCREMTKFTIYSICIAIYIFYNTDSCPYSFYYSQFISNLVCCIGIYLLPSTNMVHAFKLNNTWFLPSNVNNYAIRVDLFREREYRVRKNVQVITFNA